METLIGIKGKDFVMLAADAYAPMSICRMKNDEDKLLVIDNNKILGCAGMIGDRIQFGEYIRKNIHLYRLRNSYALSTKSTAHFARLQLANFLRKNPYQCDFLIAGYDENAGPSLYWMDYLASSVSVDKAAHGYASYLVMSIMDKFYKPNLTEEEAMDIMKLCMNELKNRFIIGQFNFIVKIIDNKQNIKTVNLN